MSNREEFVGPCQSADRRSQGRVPESLIAALHPLLRQYNVTPLQLALRCAMVDPADHALCDQLAQVSGFRIEPVSMSQTEMVSELVRPLLHRMLAQVSAQPGSLWVPDSDTLWESLSHENRTALMSHLLQRIKLQMAPVAQRFRCYPAGLSLTVTMTDPDNDAVLDEICEMTGWDVRSVDVAPEQFPEACRFEVPPSWDDLLGREELARLRPMLECHQVKPYQLSLLLAMADPNDWRTRQEVAAITGLAIQPFQAEADEIAAALHEKVGSAEEDLWRQAAIVPLFFQLDQLAPLLLQHQVLPLKLVMHLGLANPKDVLALHQIRLMTGFEVEPVEMTGSAIVAIVERMLRQAH
ncbi:hypothetical protein IV102_13735 [bacterium]|nr:hypothetical protein [bacterium]